MGSNSSTNFGYIYVLGNPSIPGLVKIGKTKSHPDGRAQQLSGETSSPTPFSVLYFREFNNMHAAERWIHDSLTIEGKRTNPRREFFRIDPKHAIDAVLAAPNSTNEFDEGIGASTAEPQILSVLLFELGRAQLNGDEDSIYHDEISGLSNLEKSAALNNVDALLAIGNHYQTEYLISGNKKYYELSRRKFEKVMEFNSCLGHGKLSELFLRNEEWDNCIKAWRVFIDLAKNSNAYDYDVASLIFNHVESRAIKKFLMGWHFGLLDLEIQQIIDAVKVRPEQMISVVDMQHHVPTFDKLQSSKKAAVIKFFKKIL